MEVTGRVFAADATHAYAPLTLVHIFARSAIICELVSVMTRAMVAAICILAGVITKLVIFALIYVFAFCFGAIFVARFAKVAAEAIVTILLIKRDLVPNSTSTIITPWSIDTHLGTLTVVLQTFVYISTVFAIS